MGHYALVVRRPKRIKEFGRDGEKGDMLNVRIMRRVFYQTYDDGCYGSILDICQSKICGRKECALTSTHQPVLSPPVKSEMRIEMARSIAQTCVTPLCPRSCTVNVSWWNKQPKKKALVQNHWC
ncbi:hypothetical protein AG1IA_02505 [Rhizoctonia solani AG-1 IA]|uniref:Uncharacterized protein n=1 Tax=Thanatephorus cucumeris (strain AG1-IA) TaxID=983506 RepID=L8X4B9_THACA|nr:hypothetical protein AG1IA_02505 [Rhizoctonia solani AG-1 IA]